MVYISIMHPILLTTLWYYETIWHTTFAVELCGQVKLPCLERCLIAGRDDTFEFILQWFVAKLIFVGCSIEGGLFHICIAERCRHSPASENLHVGFHLPVVGEILRICYIVHIIQSYTM